MLLFIFGFSMMLSVAFGFAAGFGAPRWALGYLAARREKKFSELFVNAVDIVVRGVKSGLPVGECMSIIARESPDPLGGEFRVHHKQFKGTVRVIDTAHPAMAHVPAEWNILDEWYLFKNLNAETMHVLAVLDSGAERQVQEPYNIPNYPIIWCSEYGKGRVYYNAMGHREDVWDNPDFQKSVVDAAHWALGHGPAGAEPNLGKIISGEDLAKVQTPLPTNEKK